MALIKLNNQSLTNVTSAGLPTKSGSIINVTSSRMTARAVTSGTSFTATGHNITVTPSTSSSKFLILGLGGAQTWAQQGALRIRLYRKIGTGSFADITGDISRLYMSSTYQVPMSFSYTDSPATTDAVTYEVYIATANSGTQQTYSDTTFLDKKNELTVMEIAG